MDGLLLVGFLVIIWLDSRLLKKRERLLFKKVFILPFTMAGVLWGVLGLFMFFGFYDTKILFLMIFLFLLPFYILRRDRWIKEYPVSKLLTEGDPITLASDALGVLIHWFFIMIILHSLLGSLFLFGHGNKPDQELLQMLILAVFSFIVLWVLIFDASRKFSDKGFWVNMGFKDRYPFFSTILIPIVLGILCACVVIFCVLTRGFHPSTPLGNILGQIQSPGVFLFFIFLALIVAPFAEEIIFRGYFFEVIKRSQGPHVAVIIISLVFGLLHAGQYWGDWLAISFIIILGFILTLLRFLTDNTRASVVAHYAYNISIVIIPVILILSSPEMAKILDSRY